MGGIGGQAPRVAGCKDRKRATAWLVGRSMLRPYKGKREEGLVAAEDADGTAVGGEFYFGEALADGAEEAAGVFAGDVAQAVGIGLEEIGGTVVDGTGGGLRVEVEGVTSGEADFHDTFAALHGVDAGADKIAVKKNVSGSGEQLDVGELRLEQLRVAADG